MKPFEMNLKVERTQCGKFLIREEGEAPYIEEDLDDLLGQIEDLLVASLDENDFDEPDDDFDDDEESFSIVRPVEATDLTDFEAGGVTELKGIFAMSDPRPMGKAADGDATELGSQLQAKGITGLINLTERDYTEEQRSALSSFGVEVYNFPIRDFQTPKIEDVNEIVKLTRDPQQKFAVHCTAGKGRTGTIIGCIFVARSATVEPDAAIEMIRKVRTGAVETIEQKRFITDYAAFVDKLKAPIKSSDGTNTE